MSSNSQKTKIMQVKGRGGLLLFIIGCFLMEIFAILWVGLIALLIIVWGAKWFIENGI